jgi:hypothetical protein
MRLGIVENMVQLDKYRKVMDTRQIKMRMGGKENINHLRPEYLGVTEDK